MQSARVFMLVTLAWCCEGMQDSHIHPRTVETKDTKPKLMRVVGSVVSANGSPQGLLKEVEEMVDKDSTEKMMDKRSMVLQADGGFLPNDDEKRNAHVAATQEEKELFFFSRRRRSRRRAGPAATSTSLPWLTARMAARAYKGTGDFLTQCDAELAASGWTVDKSYLKAGAIHGEDAAYLWRNGSQCVLAFRGSDDAHDMVNDMNDAPCESSDEDCKYMADNAGISTLSKGVANEFHPLYVQIKKEHGLFLMTKCSKLHVTGHSLGGALAVVFAVWANQAAVATGTACSTNQRWYGPDTQREDTPDQTFEECQTLCTLSAGTGFNYWPSDGKCRVITGDYDAGPFETVQWTVIGGPAPATCTYNQMPVVDNLNTFGAIPVSSSPLANDQASTGCFKGKRYYDMDTTAKKVDFAPSVGTMVGANRLHHPKLAARGISVSGHEDLSCIDATEKAYAASSEGFEKSLAMHAGKLYVERVEN